jgi:TolB-like protein
LVPPASGVCEVSRSVPGSTLVKSFRHFFHVAPAQEGPAGAALLDRATPRPALQDKPSIAVLPFTNLSGDPDYFTDGIVEEIITGLSRISWLFVIARNSSSPTRAVRWT